MTELRYIRRNVTKKQLANERLWYSVVSIQDNLVVIYQQCGIVTISGMV